MSLIQLCSLLHWYCWRVGSASPPYVHGFAIDAISIDSGGSAKVGLLFITKCGRTLTFSLQASVHAPVRAAEAFVTMDTLSEYGAKLTYFREQFEERSDPRVANWLLSGSPVPITCIILGYLLMVWLGPKAMADRKPFSFQPLMILYNFSLVGLSVYMFYEYRVTSWKANYSYKCQPVDYSNSELALRMASVCWWYYFSKVIEILDTVFFILRKKNNQVTFLHVYHHSSMMVNWYLGVKFVAGGQSFFLAMCNSFVHIIMYSYYGLAAMGPEMQKYLWWKRYMTQLQLVQFIIIIVHTGYNMSIDCDFPWGFNYAVFLYAISLVLLFSNFYAKAYFTKREKHKV